MCPLENSQRSCLSQEQSLNLLFGVRWVNTADDESMAGILNNFFCHHWRKFVSFLTPSSTSAFTFTSKFGLKPISKEFVLGQLIKLETNKATGVDKICAHLFKDASLVISDSLTNLFNRSLTFNIFLLIWKCRKVIPLFKSSVLSDPDNYRPITVLPTISKIFEKLSTYNCIAT